MDTQFEFHTDYHCATGILEPVAPRLRRITANNPGPLTFRGTGTYVVGEQQVAVIDPGPNDPTHFDALLSALGSESISHILVTHTHRDHSEGAAALKERCGAAIYSMGTHTALQRPSELPTTLDNAGDTDFIPDVVIQDNELITGSNWSLQCLHTPGHASNHAAFYESDFDRIFVGDLVMGWSTPVLLPPDGHLGDYLNSLRRLQAHSANTYWPTHGDKVIQTQAILAHFLEHRIQRTEGVLDAIKRGHHTLDSIVHDAYPELNPNLHAAAVRSVLASAVYLIEQGDVAGELPLGLDITLTLTHN